MRWPLRYQIMLPFAAVMLALVVGTSLAEAYLAARRTQRLIEQQLHDVAHTLSEANFPLTDAVLKQTRGLSGAEFLLVDARGHLRSASLPGADTSALTGTAAAALPFRLGSPIEVQGQSYFHAVVAIPPNEPQAAPMLLHILYPERVLREARWQAAYPPLLIGAALSGVAIALPIVIAARVSRPILQLRQQLSRLVGGEFTAMSLPARNDEMRDLIHSVNSLGDQLEEMRRAIKRSERLTLLGQLSGGLAHQLRNSVTGARIAVQLHQRHCTLADGDSLTVSLRQLALIESHLARFLTAGQPSAPRRGPCDLSQLLPDVAALVAPACRHHGVSLVEGCETPLPLLADADQLRQLLLNLVLNGIEAAGSGGWVRVEMSATPHRVAVRVLDSGPGPEASLRERLFEPFATGKPEGIGLGLAVARQIAEAHGGTIRYHDARPTCFEVELPNEVDSQAPREAQPLAALPA